jgi:hypothetical protein
MPVVSIEPVLVEGIPVAVEVTFSGKHGTRKYRYRRRGSARDLTIRLFCGVLTKDDLYESLYEYF